MGRKKQLPKRLRFTSPKHSLLHYAWSTQSPDSFSINFMRFLERAIEQEDHWLNTTGALERDERDKKRDELRAIYRRLFDKKINSIMKPCECFFSEQEENQLKVVEASLRDNDIMQDEFYIRNKGLIAANLFLVHRLTQNLMSHKDTSMVLDLKYTTPN